MCHRGRRSPLPSVPPILVAFAVALVTSACAGKAQKPAEAAPAQGFADRLTGRYMLFERPIRDQHPEVIELRPNDQCVLDFRGRPGVAGHCHANSYGDLTIETGSPSAAVFEYRVQLGDWTIRVGIPNAQGLVYARVPDPPFLPEAELLGTLSLHNETGYSVQTMFPDHAFQMRVLDLVPDDRRYFPLYVDGTFSYAAGVITYRIAHANLPRADDYIRDFVVKREGRCTWVVGCCAELALYRS
jgi:hypothetical protein